MSTFVQTTNKCYFGAYDLSGSFRANGLSLKVEPQDSATWGVDTRTNKGGLQVVEFSGEGLAEHGAGLSETVLSADLGINSRLVTYAPTTGAEGEIAYSFGSLMSQLQPIGGSVGDMAAFIISGVGSGGFWFRGRVDHAKAARGSSGTGTGRELGAVSATQHLYSALHVFAASGGTPTLDVEIESDEADDFASAVTRLTHTQFNAIGSEISRAAGPFTDTWYRVNYTIGGSTPSFTFAVVIGVR